MEHCTYDPAHEEAIYTLEKEKSENEELNPWSYLKYED